jgi:GNAT superfamily N-acetyltransferase
MVLTYFKRYRMEIDLRELAEPTLARDYRFVPWDPSLLALHADTKFRSFRNEIDANVFPCLGDAEGCIRLMREIVRKEGFLAGATWLIVHDQPLGPAKACGTVQGICDRSRLGAIQNLGVVPEYRDHGIGSALLLKALQGFRHAGLERAFLEVTAQNEGAIRLYRRLGFRKARTVFKAVDVAYN